MPKQKVMFHMDREVERKLIALNDEICTWERSTGRGYTLALIPHQREEGIHVSRDGKPLEGFRGGLPVPRDPMAEATRRLEVLNQIRLALRLRGGQ